tara:strand:- start:198 stop:455 length:258 start_codon:yes stop_codon:yes gene_type:complete
MKTETKQKNQIAYIQIRNIVFELDEVCAASKLTEDEHKFAVNSIVSAPELLQVAKDFLLLAQLHDWEGAAIDFAKATLVKVEGNA